MSAASLLRLEDAQGYADLRTFVGRARALDPEGAIRLQADGSVLAAYVGVVLGRGLLGDGAVLGLRTTRLRTPESIDVTVPLASLGDRLAALEQRPASEPAWALELPSSAGSAPWAALTPPRRGWERVGTLDGATLLAVARAGVAEVATGAGTESGAAAVADLRHRVWGRLTATVPPVPAERAFGAYALGFVTPDSRCDVVAHGRWTRLSSARGHVLVR